MTPKDKKQLTIALVIFGASGLFLAYYFYGQNLLQSLLSSKTPVAVITTASSGKVSPYLPNDGSAQIDITPVSNPIFKNLVVPQYPKVNPAGVGNPDIFKAPQIVSAQ